MLVDKSSRKYLKDLEAISWKFQHGLVVTDVGKRKLKEEVNVQTFRRVWRLKENNMRARFQERVKELVDVDLPNI